MADFRDLDAVVDSTGSISTRVLVDGDVVHQHPADAADRPWRIYSITKSIVSLVTGIADSQGLLSLDDPIGKHVPSWSQASAQVTVRHLLTMTSGRQWTAQLDDEMISTADNATEFSLGVGQKHVPGSVWQYDNIAAQVLEAVLSAATGDLIGFATRHLLEPAGMTSTTWQRDPAGNPLTYAGITSTARDLGRLGQLVLDRGSVEGRQIVPAAYVDAATSGASDANAAYGLMWWTNSEGRILDGGRAVGLEEDTPPRQGRFAPHVPADATWALGWGSQLMAVIPSRRLVAIRLGRRPRFAEDLTIEGFTRTVLDCLDA